MFLLSGRTFRSAATGADSPFPGRPLLRRLSTKPGGVSLKPSGPSAVLAPLVLGQRLLESAAGEVRPELVAEDQLGVGQLPEQVVGQPALAAGPDHQLGVVHLRRVEAARELVLVATVEGRRGADDLGPAAV